MRRKNRLEIKQRLKRGKKLAEPMCHYPCNDFENNFVVKQIQTRFVMPFKRGDQKSDFNFLPPQQPILHLRCRGCYKCPWSENSSLYFYEKTGEMLELYDLKKKNRLSRYKYQIKEGDRSQRKFNTRQERINHERRQSRKETRRLKEVIPKPYGVSFKEL